MTRYYIVMTLFLIGMPETILVSEKSFHTQRLCNEAAMKMLVNIHVATNNIMGVTCKGITTL